MNKPFKDLGEKIKAVRQSKKRSIDEVSGAIEISEATFRKIEQGEQRPAEDTLATLLSYLDIQDSEAEKYWELAGYQTKADSMGMGSGDQSSTFELNQPIAMMMPVDLRVVYTDMVHVMVNDFGVVMNFMQTAGNGSQPLAVSRIGMSREHAKSVIKILSQSIEQAESGKKPKLLKSEQPKQSKSKQKPSSSGELNSSKDTK